MMVPSLLLMSASVVASPVLLSEVKATREANHLRVEVRAEGGIDPDAARTRIDQGSLFLFLGGTHVKADNRAWKLDDGVGQIRAHRHRTETELDVPLSGNGCTGPVELQGTPTGLTALVGCDGPVAAPARGAARGAALKQKVEPKPVAQKVEQKLDAPVEEAPPAARAQPAPAVNAPAPAEAAALKTLVALPADDDGPAAEKPAQPPAKDDGKPAAAAAREPVQPGAARSQGTSEAATSSPAAATAAPLAKAAPVAPSGLRAVGLPALFLAGLAVAAYLFARKKRALGSRRIEILETASLGPKRSLVIARVGDETLVLGASEAGITLLQTTAEGAAVSAKAPATAAAPATGAATSPVEDGPSEMEQSLVDALADVPEPEGIAPTPPRGSFRSIEGGLASLFGRKAAAVAAARVEPKFDDLLEDSLEDQELRRKLAAGMSARVR